MKLKVVFAIIVCKALRLVSRLMHRGGTAMPGRYALKISRSFFPFWQKTFRLWS